MTENWIIAFILLLCCIAAYKAHSLTVTGAAAAFVVGLSIYFGFSINGLILLGTFFISSSICSKYKSSKKAVLEEKLAKGATRDWRQVFANGGTAALIGLIHCYDVSSLWILPFAVAIASANSDTWASEIGSLSRKDPIDIRTFTRIDRGTSGAISLLGSVAALAGSLLIAVFSFGLFHLDLGSLFIIFIFGFLGNIIDTVFGAFYQQKYRCSNCAIVTERKVHCQRPTIRIKGFTFVDNDMVNFLSGFIAVLLSLAVILLK
ncbi:DUF92 domain-containing protein [Neobacillus sp. PS3-12]|jgi:uncharacterized protein (TIGR00297 family)|uniref:DUF92 domain-containing protein n=1 Tax=Neobacillus sp. PS3-12 TaxID=3070677 RepID=UPI0027DFF959|nr:DUF92 domain-containing protein [Neobacillus sp. PS3-12]WML54062.1 DUF92 domain-containing protein [Neobacillus sp. PS3-12]